ncbi:MAG: hypothetical protein PHQ53_13110 [Candidatus Krumholzibacteria bacterium]|nr:hypothetical protein [Candidatus Krumholzibacteria bacterium]
MNKRTLTTAGLFLAILAAPAMAQFRTHADGGGYTYRSPSSTYMYRYDTGATYNRTGNFATYSANNGTTGYSCYAPAYRYDSFSNTRRGWSGSGVTPYASPELTTYQQTTSSGSSGLFGVGVIGAGEAAIYGFRRLTRFGR